MRDYKKLERGTIEHRKHTCMRKIPHPTEERAKYHAKKVRKANGTKMNVYNCYYCGYWHIGRSTSKYVLRQRQKNVQSELLQKEQI